MARPREFDPEKALSGAMNVFWKHGYEDASLPILLKGMGLTRGSFYKAFSDKKSLFLSILKKYQEEAVVPAVELLTDKTMANGIDRIERLFQSVIDTVIAGDRRGCMLCSTIAAPVAFEKDVAKIITKQLGNMRDGFKVALRDSQCPETDIAKIAEALVNQYVGMRVLTRSGVNIESVSLGHDALVKILSDYR